MDQQGERATAAAGAVKKALRGSWTVAQKRQIVEESHMVRANVAAVAQRHGVRPALLSS